MRASGMSVRRRSIERRRSLDSASGGGSIGKRNSLNSSSNRSIGKRNSLNKDNGSSLKRRSSHDSNTGSGAKRNSTAAPVRASITVHRLVDSPPG